MRNLLITCFTVALALLGPFAAVHADDQVYHWVDAKGVSHYSDSPPPGDGAGVREIAINSRPPAAAVDADALASNASAPPSTRSITESRRQLCERARQNLTTLQGQTDVAQDIDGDGVNELLDADQRQAELKRAQGAITAYCE
ncbi:MAG: hypothetical protein COW59_12255 [Lysobacterales bacterium CG17_big_fil_post_rev_8_21_14_2_50_64_11]|nr:MAG: hypothetical protein COW59_12255 [Xanthomonadales bacterium CG17_big_fil_post_rev_8_21_14_2_50_64_11]PIX60414.1 MAG: hypothetical protein COZ47_07350 [Xanthomonadales bacterium CG_4_10_14_3_um_filter_64_11]